MKLRGWADSVRMYRALMSAKAWIGISTAGLIGFVAVVATQQLLAPNFNPSRQTISEYVHSPPGALMVAGFLAWSVSLAALAGLTNAVGSVRRGSDWMTRLQATALLIAAGAILLVACFPTDRGSEVPGAVTQTTAAGRVHDAASAVATASILVAVLVGAARSRGSVRVLTLLLLSVGTASSVTLLAVGDPAPGVRQRALVATACLWQAVLLFALRRRVTLTSARSSGGSRCNTS